MPWLVRCASAKLAVTPGATPSAGTTPVSSRSSTPTHSRASTPTCSGGAVERKILFRVHAVWSSTEKAPHDLTDETSDEREADAAAAKATVDAALDAAPAPDWFSVIVSIAKPCAPDSPAAAAAPPTSSVAARLGALARCVVDAMPSDVVCNRLAFVGCGLAGARGVGAVASFFSDAATPGASPPYVGELDLQRNDFTVADVSKLFRLLSPLGDRTPAAILLRGNPSAENPAACRIAQLFAEQFTTGRAATRPRIDIAEDLSAVTGVPASAPSSRASSVASADVGLGSASGTMPPSQQTSVAPSPERGTLPLPTPIGASTEQQQQQQQQQQEHEQQHIAPSSATHEVRTPPPAARSHAQGSALRAAMAPGGTTPWRQHLDARSAAFADRVHATLCEQWHRAFRVELPRTAAAFAVVSRFVLSVASLGVPPHVRGGRGAPPAATTSGHDHQAVAARVARSVAIGDVKAASRLLYTDHERFALRVAAPVLHRVDFLLAAHDHFAVTGARLTTAEFHSTRHHHTARGDADSAPRVTPARPGTAAAAHTTLPTPMRHDAVGSETGAAAHDWLQHAVPQELVDAADAAIDERLSAAFDEGSIGPDGQPLVTLTVQCEVLKALLSLRTASDKHAAMLSATLAAVHDAVRDVSSGAAAAETAARHTQPHAAAAPGCASGTASRGPGATTPTLRVKLDDIVSPAKKDTSSTADGAKTAVAARKPAVPVVNRKKTKPTDTAAPGATDTTASTTADVSDTGAVGSASPPPKASHAAPSVQPVTQKMAKMERELSRMRDDFRVLAAERDALRKERTLWQRDAHRTPSCSASSSSKATRRDEGGMAAPVHGAAGSPKRSRAEHAREPIATSPQPRVRKPAVPAARKRTTSATKRRTAEAYHDHEDTDRRGFRSGARSATMPLPSLSPMNSMDRASLSPERGNGAGSFDHPTDSEPERHQRYGAPVPHGDTARVAGTAPKQHALRDVGAAPKPDRNVVPAAAPARRREPLSPHALNDAAAAGTKKATTAAFTLQPVVTQPDCQPPGFNTTAAGAPRSAAQEQQHADPTRLALERQQQAQHTAAQQPPRPTKSTLQLHRPTVAELADIEPTTPRCWMRCMARGQPTRPGDSGTASAASSGANTPAMRSRSPASAPCTTTDALLEQLRSSDPKLYEAMSGELQRRDGAIRAKVAERMAAVYRRVGLTPPPGAAASASPGVRVYTVSASAHDARRYAAAPDDDALCFDELVAV